MIKGLRKMRSCINICQNILRQRHQRFYTVASHDLHILFFGNDGFALSHLQALKKFQRRKNTIQDIDVVISSAKTTVGSYVAKNRFTHYIWPSIPSPEDKCYDLAVVVSFGHLIPKSVIELFPKGMINVHPSLLPEWRGAAPIEHTILSGQSISGVSIMEVAPHRFDAGRLLLQQGVDIAPDAEANSLREQMAQIGSEMLISVLQDIDMKWKNAKVQNCSNTLTRASKLKLEDSRVDWKSSVEQIDRQYRALGTSLHLRSEYKGLRMQLLDMIPVSEMKNITSEESLPEEGISVGQPLYLKHRELLCIKCQDGWVGFREVVLKKRMSAKAFYNGYLSRTENQNCAFQSLECGLKRFPHWNTIVDCT